MSFRVTHDFGEFALQPFEEVTNCVAWTLDNDEALYVERIDFDSGGGFHHSNWFVVPEWQYPGPDGFFNCRDRGFDELASASTAWPSAIPANAGTSAASEVRPISAVHSA